MGKKSFKYDKVLCRKFGKKIAECRKDREWTQEELAFKAGISASYLGAIERGTTDTTISTVKRLSKAFRTELSELLKF
ncbi:MAG: helix-turn-helix transcriptional regulator [Heliobacteriaceae bacterium]|jgi:transcriptional regulator with XRE-family HTH domain|nr:helix-turn-helix transcriptional regulator [Heliobacteriaceae bacterium]